MGTPWNAIVPLRRVANLLYIFSHAVLATLYYGARYPAGDDDYDPQCMAEIKRTKAADNSASNQCIFLRQDGDVHVRPPTITLPHLWKKSDVK